MMKEICQHNECTGCSACVNVCGKNAIFYCEDKIGFRYPVVIWTYVLIVVYVKKYAPTMLRLIRANQPYVL